MPAPEPSQSSQLPNRWVIVGSAENYGISQAHGFTVQGIKSRHGKKALEIRPGDSFIYYLTGLQVLASIVTVQSDYFEDYTPIWACGSKKTGELYPFRFRIAPDLILTPDQYLPTESVAGALTYLKKWPEPHWRLGFQGNVHHWPEQDYQLVRQRMAALQKTPQNASR